MAGGLKKDNKILVSRSRIWALGALNWFVFAFIALQANGGPNNYLYKILPGYAFIQLIFVLGWSDEREYDKARKTD